jgi:hypothetical protein
MITSQCPHCQSGFRADDQYSGRIVACPACKKQVQLPFTTPPAFANQTAPSSPPPSAPANQSTPAANPQDPFGFLSDASRPVSSNPNRSVSNNTTKSSPASYSPRNKKKTDRISQYITGGVILGVLVVLGGIYAFSKLNTTSIVNREKFKSIRRAAASMEAATESGVTQQKLKESIDAFTTELKLLEGDVEGAKEQKILACYVRAKEAYEASGSLWRDWIYYRDNYVILYKEDDIAEKIVVDKFYPITSEMAKEIVKKFNLKTESITYTLSDSNQKNTTVFSPDAIQTLWKIGSLEIAKASRM